MKALIGRKLGMTQIFGENGSLVPVTVVQAGPCCVVQIKTKAIDGYESVKIGFDAIEKQNQKEKKKDKRKEKGVKKPIKGIFSKVGLAAHKVLKEYKMEINEFKVGDMLTVEGFTIGDKIKVAGVSKGKGFQGVMKRYGYKGGPGSHGSMFNRAPGSIGQSSYPSRVWKNIGMPGHMGSKRVTMKNLTIMDIKAEDNVLIIKGSIPSANGNIVEIVKN